MADPAVVFDFRVPAELEGGVYANLLAVWNTAHEFTFDFAATLPAEAAADADGNPVTVVPARVTARVKVPLTVLFEILRAVNASLDQYEQQFGAIRRPGDDEPSFPPDDFLPREDEGE